MNRRLCGTAFNSSLRRGSLRLFFLLRLHFCDQPLEVLAVTQRVELGVLVYLRGVLEACLGRLLQQFHRPVGVFLLPVRNLAAGHGVHAGEVVPLDGGPFRCCRQVRDLRNRFGDLPGMQLRSRTAGAKIYLLVRRAEVDRPIQVFQRLGMFLE
jgi:hypothetical protein